MDDNTITSILLTSFFENTLNESKLISNCKLPNCFNSCAIKLLKEFDEKLDYTKKW
jgi:hypothetical protein